MHYVGNLPSLAGERKNSVEYGRKQENGERMINKS